MIKFKELRWSNIFSYGENNSLRLDSNQLTQLMGKNGNGKSSIGLILEEVLFNQNSKKLSRAAIPNRHIKNCKYHIELDFEKGNSEYTIKVSRNGTTGTVKLLKDSVDISNHTATGTYKSIEHILGYDFKTFSQIIYQSNSTSMEFLTATDTARKKFLIELLNLTKYTKASEVFKALSAETSKKVDVIHSKITTVSDWLKRIEKENLDFLDKKVVPELPGNKVEELSGLKSSLSSLESLNKKISTNNTYISLLNNIDIDNPVSPIPYGDILDLSVKLKELQKELKEGDSLKSVISPIKKCTLCGSDLDDTHNFRLSKAFSERKPKLLEEISTVQKQLSALESQNKSYKEYQNRVSEWEKYHGLIDKSLQTELLDKNEIEKKIAILSSEISTINQEISKTSKYNLEVAAHNAKVKVHLEQKDSMTKELEEYTATHTSLVLELSKLQVLVKAFSTTGLVAYKIECLVKDLEQLTNEYLQLMSGGRFQISFKINASDKLNVVITDNGIDVDMLALSNGERARVNTSTLLAIRKLMQSLSNSRTNLLILDETVENLDVDGKERLIEVLLQEDSLNTFLISHGFNHPLLEKIHIIKENNISRIEK